MASVYEAIGVVTGSVSAQVMKGLMSLFTLSGYPEGLPKQ
ncbi:hypothetical protein C8K36_102232 [Rhodococcus sp. OK519]|nr:hypothetical protein C8K36_102232 [Rhodococcus sp. OK519]